MTLELNSKNFHLTEKEKIKTLSFTVVDDEYFFKENTNTQRDLEISNKENSNTLNENLIIKAKANNIYFSNYKEKPNNFLGALYMLHATITFTLINLGAKLIFAFFPEIENMTICLFRGLLIIILGCNFIRSEKVPIFEELKKDRNKTFLLILRCFLWALCNYLLFEALKYMRISSAFTIYNISPIFTALISVIFLKSKFTKFDIFAILICFVSVCLITKPAFLNFFFNSDISGEDTYLGIFLTLLAALLSAIGIVLGKYIGNDFHFILSSVFFGIWFVFDCLIFTAIKNFNEEKPFSLIENIGQLNLISFLIVISIGIINHFNMKYFTLCFIIGEPVKILPVSYVGIVITMLYNSFIFKRKTDIFDFIGSAGIILINLKRIYDQSKVNKP